MGISQEFVLGGEATFTVVIPPEHQPRGKEDHYTYRVVRVEKSERFDEAWFVSTQNGPDFEKDWAYIGKLDPFTGQVNRTAKSSFPAHSFRFRLLNKVLARVWTGDHEAYSQFGFQVLASGRCSRCGIRLTSQKSIEIGIGPECLKKVTSSLAEAS